MESERLAAAERVEDHLGEVARRLAVVEARPPFLSVADGVEAPPGRARRVVGRAAAVQVGRPVGEERLRPRGREGLDVQHLRREGFHLLVDLEQERVHALAVAGVHVRPEVQGRRAPDGSRAVQRLEGKKKSLKWNYHLNKFVDTSLKKSEKTVYDKG